MELGLCPGHWAWLGCPILPALSQLQQGAGRGKARSDKWDWVHLVSRSNLARGWDRGRLGFGEGASLFPRLLLGAVSCEREGLGVCLGPDPSPNCPVWGLVGGWVCGGAATVSLLAE